MGIARHAVHAALHSVPQRVHWMHAVCLVDSNSSVIRFLIQNVTPCCSIRFSEHTRTWLYYRIGHPAILNVSIHQLRKMEKKHEVVVSFHFIGISLPTRGVQALSLGVEGAGTNHVERGDAKELLGIVRAGLLEHLGGDGDGRVHGVADHADGSLKKGKSIYPLHQHNSKVGIN